MLTRLTFSPRARWLATTSATPALNVCTQASLVSSSSGVISAMIRSALGFSPVVLLLIVVIRLLRRLVRVVEIVVEIDVVRADHQEDDIGVGSRRPQPGIDMIGDSVGAATVAEL